VRRSSDNPGLKWFAIATAAATWVLIWIGGLVTSHGVGMSVPDWPTTYGYNMFAFPPSKWVGGIFYEHSHRLVASGVGLLTLILAGWLWVKEERRWMRWLGVLALALVIAQGVLGGLRVTLYKDELGIFHATLAQLFLLLVSGMAFALTGGWRRLAAAGPSVRFHPWFRPALLGAVVLVGCQLVLGASMRHQHAGLAVPDFPLAYGKIWPPTDAAFLEEASRKRMGADHREFGVITANQVYLHMAHRITACLILLAGAACWVLARKSGDGRAGKFAGAWVGFILVQAFLGAYTVWSNKAADVATAHVALGAATLVWGGLLYAGTGLVAQRGRAPNLAAVPIHDLKHPAGATARG